MCGVGRKGRKREKLCPRRRQTQQKKEINPQHMFGEFRKVGGGGEEGRVKERSLVFSSEMSLAFSATQTVTAAPTRSAPTCSSSGSTRRGGRGGGEGEEGRKVAGTKKKKKEHRVKKEIAEQFLNAPPSPFHFFCPGHNTSSLSLSIQAIS